MNKAETISKPDSPRPDNPRPDNPRPDNQRKALGRGLGSLLPTRPTVQPAPPVPPAPAASPDAIAPLTIPLDSIDPNPLQPRRGFHADSLAELAQSIRSNGIIQPLVVRRSESQSGGPSGGQSGGQSESQSDASRRFQLVAGERRWRAAKLAGLKVVPVVVQNIPDDHLLEVTLIENIQREDLNPIETAIAFDRMGKELQLSAEEIGRRTGKDRSTVVNAIRLLALPPDLQDMVARGELSAGHARCLLKLPNTDLQREIAAKAANGGWSVRQLERTTAKIAEGLTEAAAKPHAVEAIDPNVKAAIAEMESALGTKVRIVEKAGGKGRIEIEYYSAEDLDRIYEVIVGAPQD